MRIPIISDIFRAFFEGIKEFFMSFKQMRQIKGVRERSYCRVLFVTPDQLIVEYIGKLSPEREWVKIDAFDKIFFVTKLYRDERGNSMVILSDKYHNTISIKEADEIYKRIKDIKEPFSEGEIKAKLHGITTNLNIYDNEKSPQFSKEAFSIIVTKAFEMLEEVPRRTILITLLFGIAIGIILGLISAMYMYH